MVVENGAWTQSKWLYSLPTHAHLCQYISIFLPSAPLQFSLYYIYLVLIIEVPSQSFDSLNILAVDCYPLQSAAKIFGESKLWLMTSGTICSDAAQPDRLVYPNTYLP